MKLHWVDAAIIVVYLLSVTLIGVVLQRRASRSLKSYLLGGNELPWYMLGLSNASGMFDISGTMWLVTIMFVYGLKSVWLPWLWPTFNQIFLMIFLSAWLRRSNVTTALVIPRSAASRTARPITARWPAWTPSKVPRASARGRRPSAAMSPTTSIRA